MPAKAEELVEDTDVIALLESGFRNVEMPPLCPDDIRDIRDALASIVRKKGQSLSTKAEEPMTEGMTELASCPFCGGSGEHIERHNPMSKWRHSIDCASSTCGASGPVEASKAEAVASWNARALPVVEAGTELPRLPREKLLYGSPDYLDDPEGLERFRQAVLTHSGHDMAVLNHNSLARLIDTIERLRAALKEPTS